MDKWYLYKIPKKAYFYWGSHMLSYLRYLTLVTFQKYNPDWEMRFYYPKKAYSGGPVWNQGYAEAVTGTNWFDKVKEIPNIKCIELDFDSMGIGYIPDVFRSDILRLQLLGTEGGLWSDMDIIYFKSLNDMCFNNPEEAGIDTVISYSPMMQHYSIGFLMSSENNPFYNFLYVHSLSHKNREGEYQHLGIKLWHQYFYNPCAIQGRFSNLIIKDIQMWLCYYLPSHSVPKIIGENVQLADPRTIALHWYAGHPDCIAWESRITPENYKEFNNTLCNTIKRAL